MVIATHERLIYIADEIIDIEIQAREHFTFKIRALLCMAHFDFASTFIFARHKVMDTISRLSLILLSLYNYFSIDFDFHYDLRSRYFSACREHLPLMPHYSKFRFRGMR